MKATERILLVVLFLTIIIWIAPTLLYWMITGGSGWFMGTLNKLAEKAIK